jgi:hypothetical protein
MPFEIAGVFLGSTERGSPRATEAQRKGRDSTRRRTTTFWERDADNQEVVDQGIIKRHRVRIRGSGRFPLLLPTQKTGEFSRVRGDRTPAMNI